MDTTKDGNKIYGEVCTRKARRKRQKIIVLELLQDYAKNSTLHGLRYITERGLSVIEKVFWLVTFAMSVAMCFYLIRNVYIKWKTSPVIVTFSEQMVSVGNVPFPSVTICPQTKCKTTVFNFSEEYKSFMDNSNNRTDNSSLEKLEDMFLVCDQDSFIEITERSVSNISLVNHIMEVAPSVGDVFFGCWWRSNFFDCSKAFKEILTKKGLCFNFNALAAHEILREKNIQSEYKYLAPSDSSVNWSPAEGYTDFESRAYPRRGRDNGASPDLEVILQELPMDRDGLCNSLNIGFKIFIQNPSDLPQDSLYYYAALPKQVSSLALKFSMITTSDSLKGYSADVRKCYFQSERELRYFKIYTPGNCRLECLSNYTYENCECVWYHMPHNDSRKICSFSRKDCVLTAHDELIAREMKAELADGTNACRCLPTCYSINYDAEILKTEFDFDTFLAAHEKLENISFIDKEKEYQYSKIEMYFKESHFVSMRRSELFGVTDFLANTGGLLGLFLGFSFLSLVEIGYFITLRLYYTLKRDLKEEKANANKQNN